MKLLKICRSIFIAILTMTSLLCWGCGHHQPSDQSLEQRFYRQRSDLERLVTMMDEDRQMSRITPTFTWRQNNIAWPRPESEWGISPNRWDDYRKIFSQARFDDGTTRREKSSDVLVGVWSRGIVPSGIGVSYLHCGQARNGYTPTEPPCIEKGDSGAGMHDHSASYGYRYQKITEEWYIYEESN
jgi:hypothetical protein